MRICGVIASLGAGGAERVMTELCDGWQRRGHVVTLLTLSSGVDDFYAVPAGVTRVPLDLLRPSAHRIAALKANVARLRRLGASLRDARPDVIVSFTDQTNVLVLIAARQLGIPVVVSERIDPRRHDPGSTWRALRGVTYGQAAAIVVQTQSVRSWADRYLPADRVHVIPNPQRSASAEPSPAGSRTTRIVSIGRLVPQKGQDTLIRAFRELAAAFPDWRLDIHGEGPDRDGLEQLVSSFGLTARIALPGRTANPDRALADASVFALSSRYEGFPNVLLEAMTQGCACVATDCDSGPSELLQHDVSGLLTPVDDVPALSAALARLMRDPLVRTRLGMEAQQRSTRFSLDTVLDQWDGVLHRVTNAVRLAA